MDELDELLNIGLQAYAAQDAPPGMEQRILRRALQRKPVRRWWWSLGLVAAGVVAAVAVSVRQPLPPGHGSVAVVPSENPPVVVAVTPKPVPAHAHKRVLVRRHDKPTEQQLALLNLVTNYPEQAVAALRERPVDISIEALKVEPLTVAELGDN